jgi:hypothetical protein
VARAAPTSGAGLAVEIDGLVETMRAVQSLSRDFERPAANAELRRAAGRCASSLSGRLAGAAAASGVPVAPKVARSIGVRSDRLPVVSITGPGTLWGSEHGPKSSPNHFAVPSNSSGYWITPTVNRFGSGEAVVAYRRAVFEILHARGLV